MSTATANEAQVILDREYFQRALQQITDGINRELDDVKPNDIETIKALVAQRQAANKIVQHIVFVAQDNDSKVKTFNAKPKNRFGF